MQLTLQCRCGHVRGTVESTGAYSRATCYCRDCQAFARFLGTDGIVNAQGGTDIVPIAPSGVAFTQGFDRVACMSLSEKGLLRWYAECCRTPIGNTGRKPTPFYFGLTTPCLDATDALLADAFGPRDRVALFAKHAHGKVAATPLALAFGGLSIVLHLVAAKLRGQRSSPFFDAQDRPVRTPQTLSGEQRSRLQPNRETADP